MAYVVHTWVRISQLILVIEESQYTIVVERELRPTAGSNHFNPSLQTSSLPAPSKEAHSERPQPQRQAPKLLESSGQKRPCAESFIAVALCRVISGLSI